MRNAAYFAGVLVTGAVLGSFLGKLLAIAFPTGRVHELFAWEQPFGLRPATLDLRIVEITLGVQFRINGTSLLGLLASALLFKKLAR